MSDLGYGELGNCRGRGYWNCGTVGLWKLFWERGARKSERCITVWGEAPLVLLGYPDSNQERQDQNLQCYHYTIAQTVKQVRRKCSRQKLCPLFASAKLWRFFELTK